MTPEDHTACAGIVRRGDPERFLAAMAAPVAARAVLFPIYAFNVEVARAPWLTQEPLIAQMRLQWWRDALEEIASGRAVRRHEVVTPLAGLLDPEGAHLLDDLIVARDWDIHRDPFDDAAHFDRYLSRTGGHLMWVAARALGAPEDLKAHVISAGAVQGLGSYLRAIPALEAAGCIPLLDGSHAGLRALAEGGLARLRAAQHACRACPKPARAALLPLWKTRALLRKVQRDPGCVGAGALDIAPLASRLLLMRQALLG